MASGEPLDNGGQWLGLWQLPGISSFSTAPWSMVVNGLDNG